MILYAERRKRVYLGLCADLAADIYRRVANRQNKVFSVSQIRENAEKQH